MRKQLLCTTTLFILLALAATAFIVEKRSITPISVESAVVSQSAPLDDILDKLAYCESTNNDHIRIVDTNGYYSYSRYQFQYATFEHYVRKYDMLPYTENEELGNWIMDGDFQRQLARTMLEDNPSNWRHWENCGKKIGLDDWATIQLADDM